MTTIHHLNCGTMCPAAASRLGLVDPAPGHLVARCLLIEDSAGLILVDTGFGSGDVARPSRLGAARLLIAPRLDAAETAVAQVRALGHDPADVRHVLLTHLDLDHAGGLGDFPNAEVHVHAAELAAARRRPLNARARYRPAQWSHGPRWVAHAESGEPWFGFDRVRLIDGLETEIALIPLFGHSAGHSGYAIRDGERWLLHAGDSYLRRVELEHALGSGRALPPALTLFHAVNCADRGARRENAGRVAELAARQGDGVTVFCSHDAGELARDLSAA